jgi:signal transduction histidine kinase
VVPAAVRFFDEPPVADPPVRLARDWVLVAVVAVGAVIEAVLRTDLPWRVPSLLLGLALIPTLLWRRTNPLAMVTVAFGSMSLFGVAGALANDAPVGLYTSAVLMVLPYALFRWGSGRHAAIGAVVLLGAGITGLLSDPTVESVGEAIAGLVFLSIPVEAGLVVRYRGAARQRAVEEARLRERADIARELHDTVAHYLSAIAVQAQAGRVVASTHPDKALGTLEVIEEAASQALEEVRSMVGVLRNERAVDLAPQQGLGDLHRLASSAPGSLRVDVRVDGDVSAVRPAVHAAAYRIVQEALTNSVRHARQATAVTVRVDVQPDAVHINVKDDGAVTGPADAASPQGYGLRGMSERAALLGGTLTAGPVPGGGWSIDAVLPRTGVAG